MVYQVIARKWRPQKFEDVLTPHRERAGKVKSFISASFVILAISLLAVSASAQQASNPPFDFPKHVDVPGEKSDEDRYREMIRRNTERSPREGPSREPRVLKKGLLAPSDQDRASYASFLRQPNTGLIRLLPRELLDGNTDHSKKPLKVRGGGRYYSFSYLSHDYGADLELATDLICKGTRNGILECQHPHKLSAASYGMLTNLGNVTLEDVTINDPRASFMLAYEPLRVQQKARCEMLLFRNGVAIDGQLYKAGLPIHANTTYLLRAFDYGQSDVLVGFRVVREDGDGGVTIAWKLLKQFAPRKLENVVYVTPPTNKCPTR